MQINCRHIFPPTSTKINSSCQTWRTRGNVRGDEIFLGWYKRSPFAWVMARAWRCSEGCCAAPSLPPQRRNHQSWSMAPARHYLYKNKGSSTLWVEGKHPSDSLRLLIKHLSRLYPDNPNSSKSTHNRVFTNKEKKNPAMIPFLPPFLLPLPAASSFSQ